jgi:hypothetical protein
MNMGTKKLVGIVALTVLVTVGPTTWGQRGMGDNEGVVRQAMRTQRMDIEGAVKEISIETCGKTTGPFGIGMHLLLTTSEDKQYNVHLGPAVVVGDLVGPLEAGQSVTVKAFRTERMPDADFVALVLRFDGKTVRLRDENLRPTWAGGQDWFFGRYKARPELPRWRQAYGRGYGRGCRAGYGRGMGRGYARGWSNGMGYGRSRGDRGHGRGPGLGYGLRMCPWGAAPRCLGYNGWWK